METQRVVRQKELDLPPLGNQMHVLPFSGSCALEDENFPFEDISEIARLESWRKEISRPSYHIHKWWGQRLGSVFRAMAIGALTPSGTDVLEAFYHPIRIRNAVVFDPFMGSGTTVGEAAKLGARAIGRDINPVAYFLVCNALSRHDRFRILAEFASIKDDVSDAIGFWYKTRLGNGQTGKVLYYFWVKFIPCPYCGQDVDLCSSQIFARHAYAKRRGTARAFCPRCGDICLVYSNDTHSQCKSCGTHFNPQSGPAKGQKATCPSCNHTFPIAQTIRDTGCPPSHRLYAKLVLLNNGSKIYAPTTDDDCQLYERASHELAGRSSPYPLVAIEPGYNTNQVLNYNYHYWHQMFNNRQLLCLSILADRIRDIDDLALRNLFTCLFSGVLEFNNMFTSYKGEGTGAVRHMFAHHILKPERLPLEANLWGTPKSSGSFMTMFEGRIRRALDYAENPFELRLSSKAGKRASEKVFGLSEMLSFDLAKDYGQFASGRRVYLSCGDSSTTDIPDQSVDVILTDPPFFNNVHYSQLADFFHVWQRHLLGNDGSRQSHTTRSLAEVQNADASQFTNRLGAVWLEANRVLKDGALLAFTYHHSRAAGWSAVLHALMLANFHITAAHPIKAEMSVAMPKQRAKEPIDFDIIMVCRKHSHSPPAVRDSNPWHGARTIAVSQVHRLRASGYVLSRNDIRVIIMAQTLRPLSYERDYKSALAMLEASEPRIEATIASLHGGESANGLS